jgi:hypothetical protein
LTTPSPVSETPKWSRINDISTIRILSFRDSCGEESRRLTPPTPGIRSSEMELDQRSGISLFRISTIRHFDTSVVKCFDTSTPGIWDFEMELFPGLRSSLLMCLFWDFDISHFDDSTFRHSCDEVFRHFNSRYPGPRNGVISWSATFFVGVPISGFWRFAFRDSGTPVVRVLDIPNPVSKTVSCFRDFSVSHFAIPGLLW